MSPVSPLDIAPMFLCIGATEVLHDWVAILTLKELRNNYSQVQQDVNLAGHSDRIDENIVDTWDDLVVTIREQGSLLPKYLSQTHLPSLLQTIAVSTLWFFSALRLLNRTGTLWGEFDDGKVLIGNLACTTQRTFFSVCIVRSLWRRR